MSPSTHHGQLYLRDLVPPRSLYYENGRYGRLFPSLPPFFKNASTIQPLLVELGGAGGPMDAGDAPFDPGDPLKPNAGNPDSQNPEMTAGMTFLGQFLDHDMTFDPTSSLERQNDPESIANFRTPAFELDSVYGSGRAASPHLYDQASARPLFLIDAAAPWDLPRNSQQVALIGDPRNDENVIVSQLHAAFLKFHNFVVHDIDPAGTRDPNAVFTDAQRLVRWHYQWIVLHQFLRATVGDTLVDEILQRGRRFYDWRNEPFVPVEFSVAAYRFGHSQVRASYCVNKQFAGPIFGPNPLPGAEPDDLRGGVRSERRVVDWSIFFDVGRGQPRRNKRIDAKLSTPLMSLPFSQPAPYNAPPASLAARNLLRHVTFSLPSGQAVARAMGEDELAPGEIGLTGNLAPLNSDTPLWFYVLQEAHLRQGGHRLGAVGGRIVAEVFIGLLQGDRNSYLRQHPRWEPVYGDSAGHFTFADLLKRAGVADEPTLPDLAGSVPCPPPA